ncbi:hypothetical protein RIR_e56129_A0A2I1DY63_9GLOM [Rhizophagus irregularis DAOM 181602=DAOM 197198]|nr:hypothetical protein RhiirB3_232638 [Rhizophagus irregularis]GET56760.1 hypothetical protein RIR_e56129_A0A2I1DY63_9GLOM [Rhizophagus irregularis DAOM 181602=DAOM 197198]
MKKNQAAASLINCLLLYTYQIYFILYFLACPLLRCNLKITFIEFMPYKLTNYDLQNELNI